MITGSRIRVLIVDDSAFMRKVLLSILSADPQIEVVGEARDGRDGVAKAEQLKPDVITMDINMPHMDGLQATEAIMSQNPRPIVIVSSESREGADVTLKALELGAIDFVAKPSGGIDLDMNTVRDELVRKIRMSSKVRVVRTAVRTKLGQEIANSAPRTEPASELIGRVQSSSTAAAPMAPASLNPPRPVSQAGNSSGSMPAFGSRPASKFPIVILAASTGGPATLMKFVPSFPKGFQGAVVLVQHMPANFTAQFATQLQEVCGMRVKEAEGGEMLQQGTFYVCPGSHHLRISPAGRVLLDDGPRINAYKPCADVTLETAAQFAGPMGIAAILTGMGNDGAKGAHAVKQYGGFVLAQDEATSVIYGMPAEAVKLGAVDQVLPIDNIYSAIEKRVLYIYGAAKVGAL
jgi:two-component system, chemotaxis family, protein-glutamate methylesterase/glutaminase